MMTAMRFPCTTDAAKRKSPADAVPADAAAIRILSAADAATALPAAQLPAAAA